MTKRELKTALASCGEIACGIRAMAEEADTCGTSYQIKLVADKAIFPSPIFSSGYSRYRHIQTAHTLTSARRHISKIEKWLIEIAREAAATEGTA